VINYHATQPASTAMRVGLLFLSVAPALNMPRFAAYTGVSINNERR
jgi:hypothetical protein